jgi:hypothetical protein
MCGHPWVSELSSFLVLLFFKSNTRLEGIRCTSPILHLNRFNRKIQRRAILWFHLNLHTPKFLQLFCFTGLVILQMWLENALSCIARPQISKPVVVNFVMRLCYKLICIWNSDEIISKGHQQMSAS